MRPRIFGTSRVAFPASPTCPRAAAPIPRPIDVPSAVQSLRARPSSLSTGAGLPWGFHPPAEGGPNSCLFSPRWPQSTTTTTTAHRFQSSLSRGELRVSTRILVCQGAFQVPNCAPRDAAGFGLNFDRRGRIMIGISS